MTVTQHNIKTKAGSKMAAIRTRHNIKTKAGNTLQVFYNSENDLLVVDLVASTETGGNEIVRMTLNEAKLLAHVPSKNE